MTTSVQLNLNIPAGSPDELTLIADRIKWACSAAGQPIQHGGFFKSRMQPDEFIRLFELLREGGQLNVQQCYEKAERIHQEYFRCRMYADIEIFRKILYRVSRKEAEARRKEHE